VIDRDEPAFEYLVIFSEIRIIEVLVHPSASKRIQVYSAYIQKYDKWRYLQWIPVLAHGPQV
jgi:hypothetical protein